MGSEKEAPSFVSQLAPKTYGLGQLDRLLLSAQSIREYGRPNRIELEATDESRD